MNRESEFLRKNRLGFLQTQLYYLRSLSSEALRQVFTNFFVPWSFKIAAEVAAVVLEAVVVVVRKCCSSCCMKVL